MKITLPISALAAILGLALAGIPANAQTTATGTTTTTKVPAAKKVQYAGTLSAIDAAGSSVTITDSKAATKTLTIAPTTKFLNEGKTATLADFAVGDKVTGSFTTDATGKMTAASLHKGGKKEKKAAKTTATGTTTPATN